MHIVKLWKKNYKISNDDICLSFYLLLLLWWPLVACTVFLNLRKCYQYTVADGQKIPQVICTEISRLNIQKSGGSFYVIFSPVYIELSLR
jgi:hypothetical protein